MPRFSHLQKTKQKRFAGPGQKAIERAAKKAAAEKAEKAAAAAAELKKKKKRKAESAEAEPPAKKRKKVPPASGAGAREVSPGGPLRSCLSRVTKYDTAPE